MQWRPGAAERRSFSNGRSWIDGGTSWRPSPTADPAAEAAAVPAVQLFVERVTAIVEDFALTDANAPQVVAICRRLDGLPLAIEFAAPRVEALRVVALAARLDDSLRLLGAQRRAAMPRHRTMQAVVDWSYDLLSEDEQRSSVLSAGTEDTSRVGRMRLVKPLLRDDQRRHHRPNWLR